MTKAAETLPVVVGVDGSGAALAAALWAVDEAIDREAPLRLVHATGVLRNPSIPYDVYRPELQYGESALRAASSAVAATGKTVKVEAEIRWDSPTSALLAETRTATMVCVGSVGIGCVARRFLGSTAASLALRADCPVVVVRRRASTSLATAHNWVVVGIDDRAGNDLVVEQALKEAQLRHAPVLAVGTWTHTLGAVTNDELEHRVVEWRLDHPDVRIYPVSTHANLPQFLAENRRESVHLAVIGPADTTEIQQIIGPHDRSVVPHSECSVMVAR